MAITDLTAEQRARLAAEQAARAAALQAQYNQPVTGPNGVVGAPMAPLGTDAQQAAIGLAAAQQAQAALPAAPVAPLYNNNSQVLAADRANVAAFVASQPGSGAAPAVGTTLPAASSADTNQRIAQALAENRTIGPMPGAADGNFNLATTSTVGPNGQINSTLRQPDNIIEGGYGGFGVGGNQAQGARQYLDRMAAEDRADAATARADNRRSIDTMDRIGLARSATQGTADDRLQARRELRAFDTRANAQSLLDTQEAGLASRADLVAQTSLAQAGISGNAAMNAALARAQATQAAANTTGQYGLQAAAIRASGASRAAEVTANSPQAVLAAQRARLIEQQLGLAEQAAAAGDISGTYAGLGLSRPPTRDAIDPVTGVPYTPEEIALQQQERLARLRAQQQQ